MNFKQLCTDMIKEADMDKAANMERILGGRYRFLGVDSRTRRKLLETYLAEEAEDDPLDWEFVETCWDQIMREFQYMALAYLFYRRMSLVRDDIEKLHDLTLSKGWWDTTNTLHRLVNFHTARFPELETVVRDWCKEGDPWLMRIALLHQLGRKEYTDTALLEEILDLCIDEPNRYVQSSIEKALRETRFYYPEFVDGYLEKHPEIKKVKA